MLNFIHFLEEKKNMRHFWFFNNTVFFFESDAHIEYIQ